MNCVALGVSFQSSGRNKTMARHDKIRNAQIGEAVASVPARDHAHAKIRFNALEFWRSVATVHLRVAAAPFVFREGSMQEREMGRVALAFQALQIAAILQGLRDVEVIS